MGVKQFNTIDEYIASHPADVQLILRELRRVIVEAAPLAQEAISYGIPTFRLNGNLVHFGAYKNHIGFYPTPSGIQAFENDLSPYERSKGAVKFPINERLPLELVRKIVRYRVQENLQKKKSRTKTAVLTK